ncbi:MAG: TylF/MycF/NovP-related O-methyltransferase [Dehalococcoidia bacterium]
MLRRITKYVLKTIMFAVMGGLARVLNVRLQVTIMHRSSNAVDWMDASATGASDNRRLFSLIDARPVPPIPDAHLYLPQPRNPRQPMVFSPWYGAEEFERAFRYVKHLPGTSRDRCYLLRSFLKQALELEGDVAECGVWKGKTAFLLADAMAEKRGSKTLHLFDTFEGMPEPHPEKDRIPKGVFGDTSLEEVQALVGRFDFLQFHKGELSRTLPTCQTDRFCFAHVDVDHYQPVLECCRFFYPRMVPGGVMAFDDYGFPSTPGAREAVDQFFWEHPETPIYLPSGQSIVIKY